ncbi:MAG: sulfite exporter TauE/SafE family protein [Cystobacterineae bacterium]|nr:sulfite exporter TauE/SafE family protein [Cystobacterineae bacterium]
MGEWLFSFSIYMGLGALVGLVAGMLGIGGGFLVVPSLLFIFGMQGMEKNMATQLAVATSLATILATSLSSAYAHHRRKGVEWPLFWRIAPSLLVGSLGGAWLSSFLPGSVVRIVFGLFAMAMALQMAWGRRPVQQRELPGAWGLNLGGGLTGLLSGVVGIGGGSLLVLLFLFYSLSMRHAIGTSAACILPIALAGALGHLYTGLGNEGRPPGTLGYIHVQAALGIAVASALSAPWGAKLAHHLPVVALRRCFALLLFFIGLKLLWENLS